MDSRLNQADLLLLAHSFEKGPERWRVGGEFERAFLQADGSPLPFFGERGVQWFLQTYMEKYGWKPKYEGDNLIELKGPPRAPTPASPFLTLEPGAQVELSGGAYLRLRDLAEELREDRLHTMEILQDTGITPTACGLTPYAKIDDILFVPKGRYAVMQRYLPSRGPRAHWMMKGTCAVQASFDFADEADCSRKFHLVTDLAPLTVAMFANSPIAEGKVTGWMSTRAWVWTQTDSARTGFPAAVQKGYTHAGWIDYLLDSPMMFYMRDGQWMPANGRSFRSWMHEGIDGLYPTRADWELHQTSVFPECRVKNTLEIRSADAVNSDLAIAFCAYWKGLLYSRAALDGARMVADRLKTAGTPEDRHLEAARHGLSAIFGGFEASVMARDLVTLARLGLREQGEELELLRPLEELVATERSPAAALLSAWLRDPSPANILPRIRW